MSEVMSYVSVGIIIGIGIAKIVWLYFFRDYTQAAVLAERERCAGIAEMADVDGGIVMMYYQAAQLRETIAAAIRQEPDNE